MIEKVCRPCKVEVETFNGEVATFRDALKANAPFNYSPKWEESFATLRRLHVELAAMEKRAQYLNEMQDLFDLTVTDYRDIRASRRGKCCYFLVLWAFSCSISHVPTRMTRLNRASINL